MEASSHLAKLEISINIISFRFSGFLKTNDMGQHSSKSSIKARIIFQRVVEADMFQKTDTYSTNVSAARIQKKVASRLSCLQSCNWATDKSTIPRSESRADSEGLVYVMDNPTGGVWVKPRERQDKTRS